MAPNVLIIGAGGVAHVAAHKCAQNNDILGDICIASRTRSKCDAVIESIRRKNNLKDASGKLTSARLDAYDVSSTVKLIRDTGSSIVINLGTAYINMSVLSACIEAGATYMDTAVHEEADKPCEDPPWYGNYEWPRKDECARAGINAILGVGFDPGVVNAYGALAAKHYFDTIDTIDMMDVNAGNHGKWFATNFDPEINFREFVKVWTWIDRQWVCRPIHSKKKIYDFPVVGKQPIYLSGHDEIHSMSKNIDARSIRFWMGFGDHYINVFTVLTKLGLLSTKPVRTAEGVEVVPLKVVKACLPDPKTLAPNYTGKTCIGDLVRGVKDGKKREVFIYNICDHKQCYNEVESQAISYTAGVPPVAAAILVARGKWNPRTMVNVEELDPDPFIEELNRIGLPTRVKFMRTARKSARKKSSARARLKAGRAGKTARTTKARAGGKKRKAARKKATSRRKRR
ncbi:MAG: saccharopine dehydrogenase [Chitinivibrionales bacterium]|nr:saccharopine dehydrogenase [Chitinivibrionales bacterium]MBD3395184.1 saccharopine dehydrogenase [Chitinivibrionales bacterium]